MDSFPFGVFLGLAVSVVSAFLFLLLLRLFVNTLKVSMNVRELDILLLGVGMNLLVLRYLLVHLKHEKTAKGLISITLVIGLMFFVFLKNTNLALPF